MAAAGAGISSYRGASAWERTRRATERGMRVVVIVVVLAAAITLGACGGEDTTPAELSGTRPPTDVEDQLGFDQAGILARRIRVESAIRDCMKARGFEYVPVDPLAQHAAVLGSDRLTDDEFLREFGYGISTLWGRGRAAADPNARIRRSLSAAERKAYDRALWGDNVGVTVTAAIDTGDFTRLGGCTRVATEKALGGAALLTELQSELDHLEERILQDQRMVRAIRAWSRCMARKGYDFDDPEEIDSVLFARMEKIVGPLPGQFATGPVPGEKPRPYDRAALARLQRDEVAIARADAACERAHITPVEERVAPPYANEFRREHRTLTERVKPVP
jgi:hypothetical protein